MTNPNSTSEPYNPDLAAVYQPRTARSDETTSSGSDRSGYARTTMRNGQTEYVVNRPQQGSSSYASTAANAAQKVPYETAIDPVTRCRVMPGEVKDDTILHFPGQGEVTARDARMLGWFTDARSAPPQPSNASTDNPRFFDESQQPPKEEVHPDLEVHLLSDLAIDKEYSALVDSTGGVEQAAAIQQVVENGEIDPRTLGTLASQLGVEPEQLSSRVAPVLEALKQQALDVMSEGGLDGNDVVAWAQRNRPDKFQQAQHKQGTMRNTSGYAELRTEYLASLADHNPSAALAADLGNGITQYQNAKGRIMVRIPGMSEMLWETAIKYFGVRKS